MLPFPAPWRGRISIRGRSAQRVWLRWLLMSWQSVG